MRSAGNFSSESGYLAPAPSFARTARIVLVATAIGATAGAGVVLSLVDRSPALQRTSVAARAIVTGVHEAAAPAGSQMSAAPIAPPDAPVIAPVAAPAASPASPPSSPVAPSEVAAQSSNHALVPPSQPAGQPAAAPSTEANASAQTPAQTQLPATPAENTAPAIARETSPAETGVRETSATAAESEKAQPHPAAGVAALAEPSATGTAVDTADAGSSAQEPASQKKVKHHANEKAPFPGLGTLFRRFFVAHAVRPNYSNR
jgi:hypothetical protein